MPAITVEGDRIMRGGEPWWFLGYNSFVWSGDCGNDDEKMSAEQVDAWFQSMRHDGHGAVRLFFFDGWNLDRLDAAVESAKENDIYLTITLDDAIGGCGENDKEAGWFADQSERDTFREHMTMLLERYEGETSIAWFEYFNEPSYEGGALREFYDEMGAAADEVDPNRLFSSGTVAPYWLDGEDNFRDVHESPGVDIASLHEYDENEVESNHGPGVRANSGGKPTIVGEYGITAGEGCDVDYAGRAELIRQKAEVYTDTSIGYAGALAWAWQPGTGGCDISNLDEDETSQSAMREFGAVVGQVGDTVGDLVGDVVGDDAPASDDSGTGDSADDGGDEPSDGSSDDDSSSDGDSEGRSATIG
ncbi:cellulase family glycosylhydrolase, partial [Pseudonocardia oceani]